MRINRENKIIIVGFFILLTCGIIVSGIHHFMFGVASSFIYATMCIIWIFVNKRRLVQEYISRFLVTVGVFLFILFMQQMIKYLCLHEQKTLIRYINYAYQIPLIAIALLSFFAALCLGKDVKDRPLKGYIWLCIPGILLIMGFMTNEFHELAYRFVAADGEIYDYGIICYIAWVWQTVLIVATLIVAILRCRLIHMRRYVWIPFTFLIIGFVYFIAYVLNGGHEIVLFDIFQIQFQNMYAFMIIGFWESCVQIGLIPSNSEYELLFRKSSLNAKITDNHNVIYYSSENADIIDETQMENADKGIVMLDDNTRIHKKAIHKGNVYWADDITAINAINEELCDAAERLREENIIIRRENELKEEKASYEVQNRMYDELAVELRHQVESLEKLLSAPHQYESEEEFTELMKRVAVYGTFLKRKANLYLLANQQNDIKLFDLYLSVKETIEYLKLSGVSGNVFMEEDIDIRTKTALLAYEYFVYVLETTMPDVKAVLVNFETHAHEFKMTIVMDSPKHVPDMHWHKNEVKENDLSISVVWEDGEVYATFSNT